MIKQKLQEDQTTAIKSKDFQTLNAIRYIIAQIKNKEIDKGGELTEKEALQVIRKQAKELQDSIEMFQNAGRTDLVNENNRQLEIVKRYLPAEMSDDQLTAEIQVLIAAHKDDYEKNPRAFTGTVVKELKSKADPQRISKLYASLIAP